jgi:16S rRNA G966 N2-methylase RsmD
MIIEYYPLDDIKPYENNARFNDDAVKSVCASLEEFGWVQPIVCDESLVIIAGHTRLKSAYKLGYKEAPVFIAKGLSEDRVRFLRLQDNNIRSDWDMAKLDMEVKTFNLDKAFDFKKFDFNPFDGVEQNKDVINEVEDENEIPEIKESVCKLGDLWQLGSHKVLCGDSTKIEDVERLMGGEKADMVFTDPPYGIDVVGGSKSFGKVGGSNIVKANNYKEIIGDNDTDTARNFYETCNEIGIEKLIIWGGNYFTDFLPPKKGWIVWDKKGRKWDDNFSDFEMAWTSESKPAKILTHVWMGMVQSGSREKRVHPTQKPVDLCISCFNYISEGSVYDGFLGSGSTLIACERTGRKCYGMELDSQYVSVILQRWADFTGNDPVREDGKKWSELKND